MAAKRYDPPKPRMSIRRVRSFKGGQSKVKLPRATSAADLEGDEDIEMKADTAGPTGPPIGLAPTGTSMSGYPPHEMRYLAYKHARWSLRVRKEVRNTVFKHL